MNSKELYKLQMFQNICLYYFSLKKTLYWWIEFFNFSSYNFISPVDNLYEGPDKKPYI